MKFPIFTGLALALFAVLTAAVATPPAATAQDDSQRPYVDLGVQFEKRTSSTGAIDYEIRFANNGTATAYDVEVVVLAVGNAGENLNVELRSKHFAPFWSEATGTLRLARVEPGTEEGVIFRTPNPGTGASRKVVALSAEASSQVSWESPARMRNNIIRRWHAFSNSQVPRIEPDYSVVIRERGYSHGTDRVDLVVIASLYQDDTITEPQEIMDARVSVDLPPGLEEDTNHSPTFAITATGGMSPTLKSLGDLSWSDGVFYIGESLDGAEFQMTLPARITASASSREPLCVTATITAQPPTGPSPNLDDASDNVSKVCLGPAPAGEELVLHSGTADLFTWYDCVGKSAPPCDRKDDGDATTNDDLQLVTLAGNAAEKFGIFQPSQVVVHVPDPAGRTVNATGDLVWSTGFENWGSCSAIPPNCLPGDRDRPGVIIARNTAWLDLESTIDDDRWGTPYPAAGFEAYETGYVKASVSPQASGKMTAYWRNPNSGTGELLWSTAEDGVEHEATAEVLARTTEVGYSSADNGLMWAEFTTLGTYEMTLKVKADYETNVNDTSGGNNPTPPTKHEDEATYTFYVGPLADLSVAGGASPAVAAGRTAFTIRASNNGPENAADAQVKIALPSGAQVEDYVASEGAYSNGVWTLPELKSRDYRRSQGKPEAATLTLILKDGGGVPQEPAEGTISLTDNSYTVCIDSDRNTLAHETQADCKADAKTTDTWHTAVCVQDSDQTVNTTTTHNTQAKCGTKTGHTWTANVCANDDGKVIAGYTEAQCDGWHTGTVYDPPANNTAKITAAKGTGVGPDIPANVTTQTGATTVTWDEVEYLHGLPVASYQLHWLGGDWTMLADAVIENEFVDDAPTGRRAYRVRAVNAAGVTGPWSRSSVQAALGSPGPPQNVSARADGNNAIDVSWASPEDAGNSPVTGYRVEWSADPEEGRWSGANTTELTYKHRNLQTASTWHYRVAARNRGGLGVWSDPVMGTTAPTAPDAPGNFRATTLSDYEIELTWNKPKDNGKPITGYQLERSRDGSADSWSRQGTPGADATAHTDSTLDANTRYYYRVRAVNSVGAGAWSRSISAMTQLTPPDAPSLTSVEADGPNAIIVTWEEPWYLGDLPVTQYQVQWAKDQYSEIWRGPQTLSGSARSWRHTGLKPDETWYYQVRASNGGGRWSVWSYISAATTASDNAPKAVGGFRAQYDKDARRVNLTWNDLSGSETTFSYDLEHSEDGGDWRELTTVSSSSCEAGKCAYGGTDVWPGARLSYRIRASIDGDAGPWSSTQSVSVPPDPPDAPRYRWVEADGSNHIVFLWDAPYYDGGAAITGYRLLWCRALDGADENPCEDAMEESNSPADPPGYSRISVGASARSYTHSVSPGYNYYYLVRATNGGNRWSEWDEYDITGYVRTYAGVPAAPSLTARAVDANQIKLTWSRPSSSGSEISEYWLYIYENGEDLYDWDNILDILRVPGDRTEWTVGDLSPETTRYFRIRALNDNGEGKYSALRQATTPSG